MFSIVFYRGAAAVAAAIFLSGCSAGKLSAQEGRLRFSVPFELAKPQERKEPENETGRLQAIDEEVRRLETERDAATRPDGAR